METTLYTEKDLEVFSERNNLESKPKGENALSLYRNGLECVFIKSLEDNTKYSFQYYTSISIYTYRFVDNRLLEAYSNKNLLDFFRLNGYTANLITDNGNQNIEVWNKDEEGNIIGVVTYKSIDLVEWTLDKCVIYDNKYVSNIGFYVGKYSSEC